MFYKLIAYMFFYYIIIYIFHNYVPCKRQDSNLYAPGHEPSWLPLPYFCNFIYFFIQKNKFSKQQCSKIINVIYSSNRLKKKCYLCLVPVILVTNKKITKIKVLKKFLTNIIEIKKKSVL